MSLENYTNYNNSNNSNQNFINVIKHENNRQAFKEATANSIPKKQKGYVTPGTSWQGKYKSNVAKLALLSILYVFNNDDGEVTKIEEKMFKMALKSHKKELTKLDIHEVIQLAHQKITKDTILLYISENNLSESIIKEATDSAKKFIFTRDEYIRLLNSLFI